MYSTCTCIFIHGQCTFIPLITLCHLATPTHPEVPPGMEEERQKWAVAEMDSLRMEWAFGHPGQGRGRGRLEGGREGGRKGMWGGNEGGGGRKV